MVSALGLWDIMTMLYPHSGRDNYESYGIHFNDGKHYNKKNKQSEKKSRNNVKQSLHEKKLY